MKYVVNLRYKEWKNSITSGFAVKFMFMTLLIAFLCNYGFSQGKNILSFNYGKSFSRTFFDDSIEDYWDRNGSDLENFYRNNKPNRFINRAQWQLSYERKLKNKSFLGLKFNNSTKGQKSKVSYIFRDIDVTNNYGGYRYFYTIESFELAITFRNKIKTKSFLEISYYGEVILDVFRVAKEFYLVYDRRYAVVTSASREKEYSPLTSLPWFKGIRTALKSGRYRIGLLGGVRVDFNTAIKHLQPFLFTQAAIYSKLVTNNLFSVSDGRVFALSFGAGVSLKI